MGTNFENVALSQLMQWVKEDRKTAEKIYKLIQDIHRNGLNSGIGKPERVRPKTYSNYVYYVSSILPMLGEKDLQSVRPRDVDASMM